MDGDYQLARLAVIYTPTAFSPWGYLGTFWDTTTFSWVQLAFVSTTELSGSGIEDGFEAAFPDGTFPWSQAAPPAP